MTSFTPQNPEFEARVRASFARQEVMRTIGATLASVQPGAVEIVLPFRADLTQQHGFLHAGIVATILDSACGYAAFSLMPANMAVLAVEFKINLLSPAKGRQIVAKAQVKRAGRTLTVCTADAYAHGEGEPKLVATMLSTIIAIPERDGLREQQP
ncbi:MAG: PaaI family thioesterase [bacterium]